MNWVHWSSNCLHYTRACICILEHVVSFDDCMHECVSLFLGCRYRFPVLLTFLRNEKQIWSPHLSLSLYTLSPKNNTHSAITRSRVDTNHGIVIHWKTNCYSWEPRTLYSTRQGSAKWLRSCKHRALGQFVNTATQQANSTTDGKKLHLQTTNFSVEYIQLEYVHVVECSKPTGVGLWPTRQQVSISTSDWKRISWWSRWHGVVQFSGVFLESCQGELWFQSQPQPRQLQQGRRRGYGQFFTCQPHLSQHTEQVYTVPPMWSLSLSPSLTHSLSVCVIMPLTLVLSFSGNGKEWHVVYCTVLMQFLLN